MAVFALWLYRIAMAVSIRVFIPVAAVRDRLRGKARPAWSDRFVKRPPRLSGGGLWIQAVSVGEVEVARRLIAEMGGAVAPETVVTATTATGLALARKTLADRVTVLPCPVDLPAPLARFFGAVRPRALLLVETELWPEMLVQAGRRDIPVAVVNARLSDASFRRYRRVRRLLEPLLAPISLVLARDESDAERFRALGIDTDRVVVGGNVKYDMRPDERPLEWDEALPEMADGRPVLVAGSTMEGEEAPVLRAVEAAATDGVQPFLVLAPRHPERCDAVAALIEARGLRLVRRSRWPQPAVDRPDVFMLDTIGELARAYRHASVAFIGGSLVPTGGHNPLEALVWGVPVLSGPSTANFEEVFRETVASGGVRLVDGAEELAVCLSAWLTDPEAARSAGESGRRAVEANRGATGKIAGCLASLLGTGESR